MQTIAIPLPSPGAGTQREITALKFGAAGAGPKAYVQAALHADELPGMLAAHHLRRTLIELEQQGAMLGQVVLVPVANPIGLAQTLLGSSQGRFDLRSGQNFNRMFPNLSRSVLARVESSLSADSDGNKRLIRAAISDTLLAQTALDELGAQRLALMRLASDADIVLDLHCDCESVLHVYTSTPMWDRVAPLAALLGARVALLSTESGDDPFDEAFPRIWWDIAAEVGDRFPIPLACLAATVELRGFADVTHEMGQKDAEALIDFLILQGVIAGPLSQPVPLVCEPTPLAGCMPLVATSAGLLVYRCDLGARVKAGDPLVDVIDPVSGVVETIASPVDGLFFARENRRYVPPGTRIGKVAGREALRSGPLLSA